MNLLFISLGCDKNLVDSEVMLGLLAKEGYQMVDDEQEADVIVINTCCFIHDAKEESIQTILEMAQYKEEGRLKALIVTGCLAQRYQQEILDEIPEVDAVLGTTAYTEIVRAIEEALEGKGKVTTEDLNALPLTDPHRIVTTGGHYAYLKIAEGCGKHCTYCIIPKLRGDYRSVPMERLIAEAKDLAEQGVRELILVAQETTLYGKDLYGEKSLHKLLDALNEIPGLFWIRIMYCYPEEIYEELIDAIARNEKVCHYLDLPIQHANDTMLKRMGRRTSNADLVRIITHLRERIPDITLRTTLICGFPGETKEMHEELMQFINDMEFDRLGAFTYSPEEGTPAARMLNRVDTEEAQRRAELVMEIQTQVMDEFNDSRMGDTVEVLCDGWDGQSMSYVGRSYAESPGIDGNIYFTSDQPVEAGDFVRVRITGAMDGELTGERTEE